LTLTELAGDLSKFKEAGQQQDKVSDVTWCVRALWTQANRSKNSVQKQLSRIEEKLDNLTVSGGSMNQAQLNVRGGRGSTNQTWAGVVAQGIRQLVEPLSQRTAVRVRLPTRHSRQITHRTSCHGQASESDWIPTRSGISQRISSLPNSLSLLHIRTTGDLRASRGRNHGV